MHNHNCIYKHLGAISSSIKSKRNPAHFIDHLLCFVRLFFIFLCAKAYKSYDAEKSFKTYKKMLHGMWMLDKLCAKNCIRERRAPLWIRYTLPYIPCMSWHCWDKLTQIRNTFINIPVLYIILSPRTLGFCPSLIFFLLLTKNPGHAYHGKDVYERFLDVYFWERRSAYRLWAMSREKKGIMHDEGGDVLTDGNRLATGWCKLCYYCYYCLNNHECQ